MEKFLQVVRNVKYTNFVKRKLELKHAQHHTPFEEKSLLDEILEICDYPFLFVLYLTALPTQEEYYSKLRCMVYSIPGMIFAWYILHPILDMTYVTIALPAGVALFFFFAAVLPNDNTPPRWFLAIAVAGVVAGLMWSYILIGALIDMLELIGVVENLDETFLGLTILAIGNALPDALTTVSLVKSGAGTMAISGGYAGQLFGYLVGFGISMLKVTLKKGPQTFDLFEMKKLDKNMLDLAILLVALVVLCYTFLTGIFNKFKMNKLFATNLVVIYVVFIVFSTVVAIVKSIKSRE